MHIEQRIDQSANHSVSRIMEEPLIFGKVCTGQPVPNDHFRFSTQNHIRHFRHGRIRVVPVGHNIAIGVDVLKHRPNNISLSLRILFFHDRAGFSGDLSCSIGRIVVVDINVGCRKCLFIIFDYFFYRKCFVITRKKHCDFFIFIRHFNTSP